MPNRLNTRPFRIVTHRSWLAALFQRQGGVQDFGMDIMVDGAQDTLWWAPGHWVARAAASGVHLPLTSCGQKWLADQPRHLRGRRVVVVPSTRVIDVYESWNARALHLKLPEVKTEVFEASVRDRREALLDTARLDQDQLIQVSEPVMFVCEARFFIANGAVTAWSWYRLGEHWYGDENFDPLLGPDPLMLRGMASAVARTANAPRGYSVDIGFTEHGVPLLIEANASWSANPYDADITGVFSSVVAAHDFDGTQTVWRFDTEQYGKVAPLRIR